MDNLSAAATIATRALLTSILLGMSGALIWILVTHEIPNENRDHVWTLVGIVGTLTTLSVNWWFGGSKGSTDQTDQLLRERSS